MSEPASKEQTRAERAAKIDAWALPLGGKPSKVLASQAALSSATDSISASGVNLLINRWEGWARDHRQAATADFSKVMSAVHLVIAEQWDTAVSNLRVEMARATERQPEDAS